MNENEFHEHFSVADLWSVLTLAALLSVLLFRWSVGHLGLLAIGATRLLTRGAAGLRDRRRRPEQRAAVEA